jgi:Acyl-CoA dehydrogenase, C-terminal domain
VPPAPAVDDALVEARAFADSVAGVVSRHPPRPGAWLLDVTSAPSGRTAAPADERALTAALDQLGWSTLAQEPELVAFAGLGAVELGRALACIGHVDRLLGGAPLAGQLVRGGGPAVSMQDGELVRRAVLGFTQCPSGDGLDVRRVDALGEPERIDAEPARTRLAAWRAASVGYLAGLGQAALDLTVDYVRQRRAFGTTLAALGPVQQLLAGAATSVRGVRLLAGDGPGPEGLAHAGPAIAQACAACHQVTGAIGFTLEYPLHRFTQRARGLAAWNDRLLDGVAGGFA